MTCRVSTGRVSLFLILLALIALAGTESGCGAAPNVPIEDEAKAAGKTVADFPPDAFDYFAQMDQVPGAGAGQFAPLDLTPPQIQGRNTWMLWTGGNEAFWDWLANYNPGFVDLLKLVNFNPERQWRRFERAGLIVEPDTAVPATADLYGLYIRKPTDERVKKPDEFRFGRSSGIVGLRLYDNPKFDAAAARRWDVKRYYDDPSYYLDPSLVRPYRVGMSCAFCHVGPHPLSPPANVEEPLWSNLSATIGSQYLRTRAVFGNLLTPDNFYYHLLDSQLPGTLDTSLIPSDNINNANAENAIFELGGRLDRSGSFSHRPDEYAQEYLKRYGTNVVETVGEAAARWPVLFSTEPTTPCPSDPYGSKCYANPRPVPRVLMDGADSVGPWAALARVYLNIGTYHQRWVTLHNPLFGFTRPKPFATVDAAQHSVYWVATEALMDDLARYLAKASSPMRLKDAPNGTTYVKGGGVPWAPELAAGQKVFASHCIVCHSSKQPKLFDETLTAQVLTRNQVLALLSNPDYKGWAEAEVKTREFWEDNYLSTDRRLPVTLVGTNAARALGSNGIAGSMWEEFTSKTYKDLPSAGTMQIWNPFRRQPEDVKLPAGGRGYYRPPTLVSVWATAPFLHNNSVGNFNNDPSVDGRVRAFNDAINKLLVSGRTEVEAAEKRWELGSNLNEATPEVIAHDHGVIWRLPQDARLRIPANQLPLLVASAFSLSPALVELWLITLFVFTLATFSIIAGRRLLRWFGYFLTVLALVAAGTQPWIIPLVVFVLAGFFIFAGRRLIRRVGYVLTLLGFGVAGLTSFAAGRVVDLSLSLPRGLPVNLVANLDFERLDNEGTWTSTQRVWRITWELFKVWPSAEKATENSSAYKTSVKPGEDPAFTKLDRLGAELNAINKNRDHVMDRGHYVGASLTVQERQDLIDLLLTF